MLNIQQHFRIKEVFKTEGGFVMVMTGKATYDGKHIHTTTNDDCRDYVEVNVHCHDDDPSEWYVCDMGFFKIGDAESVLNDDLPEEVQEWFSSYHTAQLLNEVINGTTDAPIHEC